MGYNIKIDLTEIGCDGVEWIHLAQDKDQWPIVVNTVIDIWVPENPGNVSSS
jgi:hypothetical protein